MPKRGVYMAIIKRLSIEIEPSIPDVLAVISLVTSFHPGQEAKVLRAIRDSTDKKLQELEKGKVQADERNTSGTK